MVPTKTDRGGTRNKPTRLPADSLAYALHGAAQAIAAVIGGRNFEGALAALELSAIARPAVMDLAYGTLRDFGRGDFFLARLMRSPVAEPTIRGLLLASLHRLEARPDEAYAIVDQSVSAAALPARGNFKNLVNGVLRNFMRRRDELIDAAQGDEFARWRHPKWWLEQLRTTYPDRWQEVAAAGNSRPPMTLRVNRGRSTTADYCAELEQAKIAAQVLEEGAIRLDKPMPVDRLPGFRDGRVSVQDWGAQRAAVLLDAIPGMRVLDACAAPGGKTAHVLERADVAMMALDADAGRARRIDENLERLGLRAQVKVADCRNLDAWWDGRPFERILADVPCSASGVARRHPDIKWLRRAQDIAGFATLQREIVDALWRTLAPGGKMLYATCSLFTEENAAQVSSFLSRHDDALRQVTHGGEDEWQLTPDINQDGFYYALIAKR